MSEILIKDYAGRTHSFGDGVFGHQEAWNFAHREHLAGRPVSDGTCGGGDLSRVTNFVGRSPFGRV